jgi:hypothetical protein
MRGMVQKKEKTMSSPSTPSERAQRTDKAAGWLLGVGATISIAFMLLHPEVNAQSRDAALKELLSEAPVSQFVHGSLILTIVVILAALERFADRLSAHRIESGLGLAFYRLGSFAFILAALISGFIITDLGQLYAARTGAEQEIFFDLARLAKTMNNGLSKLASVFYGLTALIWGAGMLRAAGIVRWAGLASAIIGAAIAVAIVLGLDLDVQGMTLVVVGLSLWQGLMAWLLIRTSW